MYGIYTYIHQCTYTGFHTELQGMIKDLSMQIKLPLYSNDVVLGSEARRLSPKATAIF